jgi:hypothetical protein
VLPALHDKLAEYRARVENMRDTLVSEHRHVLYVTASRWTAAMASWIA